MTYKPQTILLSEERIRERVTELGRQIRDDYGDRPITCVCVLKGSFIFIADLARAIGGPVRVEFMGITSYQGGSVTTGAFRITQDLAIPIEGHDCLVVEDIVDTGRHLHHLLAFLQLRKPRTLRVCTLLDKPEQREVEVKADYVGFTIPDVFVVGYGFDLGEYYRNLPYIAVYSP